MKNQENIELLKTIFSLNYDFHFFVQVFQVPCIDNWKYQASIKFDVKQKISKSKQTKQKQCHSIQLLLSLFIHLKCQR